MLAKIPSLIHFSFHFISFPIQSSNSSTHTITNPKKVGSIHPPLPPPQSQPQPILFLLLLLLIACRVSESLSLSNSNPQISIYQFELELYGMGCTSSKLDDLPAVALCRDRCSFLDEAIHQRYALAAAHVAYISSLTAIGHSLHSFVHHDRDSSPSPPPSPPPKNHNHHLPKHASPSPPHSDSGSHLHFHSDSDEEEQDDEHDHHHDDDSLHHSQHSSPLHLPNNGGYYIDSPPHHIHMNFMKKAPIPSIVYQQRPMSPQNAYVGESSSSFYPYQQPYPYNNNNNNNYNYNYNNYSNPPPSSFYGSSPPPPAPSSSKPPPPPPSPPRTSTWDFLNFFDSDEKYYSQPQYTPTATPSRDSKEVREEEGIPDLEDEDYQHEVVKKVYGDQKLVDPPNHAHAHAHDVHSSPEEESGVEYEVHVVDKKVVDDDDKSKSKSKPKENAAFRTGSRDPLEVAKEIQILFQRASDSGNLIADILEVGKLRYNHKGYILLLFFLTDLIYHSSAELA